MPLAGDEAAASEAGLFLVAVCLIYFRFDGMFLSLLRYERKKRSIFKPCVCLRTTGADGHLPSLLRTSPETLASVSCRWSPSSPGEGAGLAVGGPGPPSVLLVPRAKEVQGGQWSSGPGPVTMQAPVQAPGTERAA